MIPTVSVPSVRLEKNQKMNISGVEVLLGGRIGQRVSGIDKIKKHGSFPGERRVGGWERG
jgi:hypothetical protein